MSTSEFISIIISIAAIAIPILTNCLKSYLNLNFTLKFYTREKYEFLKELYADLRKESSSDEFIQEKAAHIISGDNHAKLNEIKYFLSCSEPMRKLEEYKGVKNYLEFEHCDGIITTISLKKKYLKWSKTRNIFIYLLIEVIVLLALFMINKKLPSSDYKNVISNIYHFLLILIMVITTYIFRRWSLFPDARDLVNSVKHSSSTTSQSNSEQSSLSE